MVATLPPATTEEPPTEGEAPTCPRVDCYICHPDIPLPWWAYQSRRFQVHNRITVALRWYEQALTSTAQDRWHLLGNAEQAVRAAVEIMDES